MRSKTITVKISDKEIKNYESTKITTLRDHRFPALRFRFKAENCGSWFVVLNSNGKTTWKKIANYPAVSAKEVIKQFPQVIAKHELDLKAISFDEWKDVNGLVDWFNVRIATNRNLSEKRKRGIKSVIKLHLKPRVGDVLINNLNHKILNDLLIWPLQEKYAISTVRLILAVLKVAFKQASTLNLIERDPIAGLKFSDFINIQIKPKDCALKASSISELLVVLTRKNITARTFILMILMHGTRIGETRTARWSNIDFKDKFWFIPANETKTKTALKLPLTASAIDLLTELKKHSNCSYLFTLTGSNHCLNEVEANNIIQDASSGNWHAHDLRKLARTVWLDLGVDYMVGEMLLNHALSMINKTYIHTHAEKLIRQALEKYHVWIKAQNMEIKR